MRKRTGVCELYSRCFARLLLILFWLQFPSVALAQPPDNREVKHLARDIFQRYLRKRAEDTGDAVRQPGPHQAVLQRPRTSMVVGIDAGPGAGKTSLLEQLERELRSLAREYQQRYGVRLLSDADVQSETAPGTGQASTAGGQRWLVSFGIDQFLYGRAERYRRFSALGDGASGNCNGQEYRWDEMLPAIRAISERRPFTMSSYDRKTREVAAPGERFLDADIVLLEGTHVLDECLIEYMDYPVFLDIDDNLLDWSRRRREVVERGRGSDVALAIIQVVHQSDQLPVWREANAGRARSLLEFQPEAPLPALTGDNINSPPYEGGLIPRRMIFRRVRGGYLTGRYLNEALTLSSLSNTLLTAGGILPPEMLRQESADSALGNSISSAMSGYGEPSTEDQLEELELVIITAVSHDHDCLFHSLGAILGEAFDSREKVLALLQELLQLRDLGQLTPEQMALLETILDFLDDHIQYLLEDNDGELYTVMYFWAALLAGPAPPTEPLLMVIILGDGHEVWQFNQDGTITQLQSLPENANALFYDGQECWLPVSTVTQDEALGGEGDSGNESEPDPDRTPLTPIPCSPLSSTQNCEPIPSTGNSSQPLPTIRYRLQSPEAGVRSELSGQQ